MRDFFPGGHREAPRLGGWAGGLIVVGIMLCSRVAADSGSTAGIDFSRQILPILSDNCFACHGPDATARKAGLRLDLEAQAKGTNKFGDRIVVPGDPEASLLVERITTSEVMDRMPPEKSGKSLTDAQRELLRQWVAAGAPYEKHWAFVPPQRPALPEVRDADWPRNPIDRFVLARLEQEGVEPAKRANRRTLARRATLDLTGLPPTPQEVEAFLNDKDSGAYERLVDRLLESPRYGENMAKDWLDASRYADSHGYHIDAERHLWKWRSWVIDAYNRNLPFDQFTTEQLAGDLLPESTKEQKVASGFIRNNMSTGEGGAIVEEYQAKYTFDRTETTSTIWMGLTMTCARCHTHKYDPITQTEYYRFYAFFNNLDESVMDGNQPNPEPFLKLPSPAQAARLEAFEQQIADGQEALDRVSPESESARAEWRREWRARLLDGLTPLAATAVTAQTENRFEAVKDGAVELVRGDITNRTYEVVAPGVAGRVGGLHLELWPSERAIGESVSAAPVEWGVVSVQAEVLEPAKEGGDRATRQLKFRDVFASSWKDEFPPAKVLDGDSATAWVPDPAAAEAGGQLFLLLDAAEAWAQGSEVRVRLTVTAPGGLEPVGRVRLRAATGEGLLAALFPVPPSPWKVLGPLAADDAEAGLAHVWDPESGVDFDKKYQGVKDEVGWSERSDLADGKTHLLVNSLHGVHGVFYLTRKVVLPEEREVEITLRADDLFRVWIDSEPVAERTAKAEPGDAPVRVRRTLAPGEHQLLVKIANLQGDCYFAYDQDLGEPLGAPGAIGARLLATLEAEGGNAVPLRRYFRRATDVEWKKMDNLVAQWKEGRDEVNRSVVTTMVAKERKELRETHLLMRGEYDHPGEVVAAGVPAILPPLPGDAPRNRLGLARWLVDPGHPLTARVTVNRFWQHYFGVGLVKTAEDFGIQGERPSHPELLDWLATEFVQSGWDIKHLQKLIVMSATYRQSSFWRPELAERDPENRLLARGARFRVDAEVLRDSALSLSGLLKDDLGGASVKPYEPAGLWEAVSFNNSQKYVQDLGDANYRRSLYTHWKRQSPPPSMLLFDAPTREYCVVRRPRTNTPLQAMVLLNDPQFVEAARALAWRVMQEGGPQVRRQLRYAFQLVTCRRPSQEELAVLVETYRSQLDAFREDPDRAREYLRVGAFRAGGEVDEAELAAMASVAGMLLNLDETLTKS